MRDLMAITERPEVISLAGGLPDTSTFPAEQLAAVMARVAADSSARALQYGPTEGMLATRETIARVMAAEGPDVDPDDVLVTTGGQQVIDLVCKSRCIDPGDVIVAEGPTYPGAVPTFSSYQADVVQIGMDEDGMRVDELEDTLDRLEREGRRPKFIYTIPNFQNPAGVTLSLPRRQRIVEVAHERELIVLEDNPYGMLRYEGDPMPTLLELDGGQFVVYAGTFSKILSPGLRLGWAVAPRPVLAKLNLAAQAETLCPSSFTQHFVNAYFQTGHWERYMDELRELYPRPARHHARRARRAPPGRGDVDPPAGRAVRVANRFRSTWTRPTCSGALALSRDVAFVPGRAAYLDGRGASAMRLNFSGSDTEAIREGVRRIGAIIHEQIAMYGTLTGAPAPPAASPADAPASDLADVLGDAAQAAGRPATRRRGPSAPQRVAVRGRTLARAPGVPLFVRRARRARARAARAHGDRHRRRSRPRRPPRRGRSGRRVRRPARSGRRGRHRRGTARRPRPPLHRSTAGGVLDGVDKVLAST